MFSFDRHGVYCDHLRFSPVAPWRLSVAVILELYVGFTVSFRRTQWIVSGDVSVSVVRVQVNLVLPTVEARTLVVVLCVMSRSSL